MLWPSVTIRATRQGDVLYEELMRLQLQPGLVFNPNEKQPEDSVEQRFLAWMKLKQRKLDEAKAKYEQVRGLKNPHFTIAAAARISQLYLAFANGLYRAAIPAPTAPPSGFRGHQDCPDKEWAQMKRDAFCDQTIAAAEPLERLAKEHLVACLSESIALSESSDWSRLCEQELHQLSPEEYPLPSEIRVEPDNAPATLDVAVPRTTDTLRAPSAGASPGPGVLPEKSRPSPHAD